jgi:TonB family protein
MRSREEFGKYLLLKKLSEDPLGETFRAARGGGQDVEQVVLLRVFNGQRLDGNRLWQRISDRGGVQQALKNPNIGNGVDLGAERGVPYVAYDYISGRNLENLLIQASNTNSPIPLDHALLIVERMALALSAATETRAGDGRVVHGFAVPHLVMVSNEGETRVLGFEAAPGLAEQAGNFEPEITRYLAPEVIAGHPVDRSDDVFTLGAVLYELVACRPLPAAGGDWAGAINTAQVAHDGTPLPPDVATLLRRSLAPRGQRIADSGDWHKALSQLVADGGYAATTFNLAFFMHNLFRHEIERENQEIEEEKTMVMEAPLVAPAPAPPALEAMDATGPGVATHGVEEKKGGRGALIGALAALLLLAAVGVGWYFLAGPGAAEPEPEPVQVVEPEPEPPPEPQGPSPEEIQAQLAEMIDARSDEMESKLREQYDERIRTLQNELVAAEEEKKRIAAQREQQRIAEEQAAAAEAARLVKAEEDRLAAEEAARQAKAEEEARKQAAEQQAAAEPEPPPPPKTKEGDLVTMAAGVSPPQLTTQPEARYPAMAKKLGREADVDVRVLVDERGNVREATVMSQKKAGFGFDEASLDAARAAKYRPATKDGVRVKMYVTLTIRFNL